MRLTVVDTGPLVALLDRRDRYHEWAVEQVARLPGPFSTCEPVITEAFHLLRRLPKARIAILEMLAEGVLAVPFRLEVQHTAILQLLSRYENVPMSLADACLVRISELTADCVVLTLDSDFRVYRRHRRRTIPLLIPPDV